jgi:hypothetical protein
MPMITDARPLFAWPPRSPARSAKPIMASHAFAASWLSTTLPFRRCGSDRTLQLQPHSWEENRISFVQYEEKAPGIWKYLWKSSEISIDTEKIRNYS